MFGFLWQSSWRVIVGVLVSGVISGLSSAALIALINSVLSNDFDRDRMLVKFISLCAAVLVSSLVSRYLINRLSTETVYNLRLRTSRLILNAPYVKLMSLGKHRLLANLTEDIASISGAFASLPDIGMNVAVVSGCMVYLTWLSWQLALAFCGLILVGMVGYKLLSGFANRYMEKARNEYDALSLMYRTLTEAIKELKLHSHRRAVFMEYSLAGSADAHRRLSFQASMAYQMANGWAEMLFLSAFGLIIFAFSTNEGSHEVINGYVLVFLFMMPSLSMLTTSIPTFMKAKISIRRVDELGKFLQADIRHCDANDQPVNLSKFQSISLCGITHRFHREKENSSFTLGPINLEFRPGELVFLIGGNGSGKTTLAMLLIGLYVPETGGIKLNGISVSDANREAYLQNFSVVFSDFHLFDELLGFDARQINDKAISFLERLHLHHKVSLVNGKFTTLDLSQGQRKRLALLVAYLEDRPFYVFDEWAADQDPEFKEIFYTELLPSLKAKGKTVLVITHDDRYFHLADRCIKLDDGQIIATGVRH